VLGLYVESATDALAPSAGFARHTLKAGHNLRDFAKAYLGDAKRWRDVADLNRDDPKCPSTSEYRVKRPVVLLTPPREPVSKAKHKRAKRGK
jgi:nucleoid-associated protein YgaU